MSCLLLIEDNHQFIPCQQMFIFVNKCSVQYLYISDLASQVIEIQMHFKFINLELFIVGRTVGQSVGWWVGWLDGRSVGWLVGRLVNCLAACCNTV